MSENVGFYPTGLIVIYLLNSEFARWQLSPFSKTVAWGCWAFCTQ